MSKFITGVIPSPPDKRDYIYSSIKPITTTLPSKFLLKEWQVNDQKNYGSCVGQACSAIKDWQETKEWGEVIDTSPLFVYSKCKQLDGLKQAGTYPRISMQVLKDYGICKEKDFLYSLMKDDINPPIPSKEVEEKSKQYKIKSYARLFTIDEIKQALVQENGPVLLALIWVTNMSYPENGYMPIPNGKIIGGHAMAITGYDDNLEYKYNNGEVLKGFFRVRNSWSSSWGNNGYCWISYKIINTDMFMEAWATLDEIINPNPNPQPEPKKEEKKIIKLYIGKKEYYINDEKFEMDTEPIIKNNRTFVPVRFVAEALNAKVDWNATKQEIIITQK